MSVAKLSMLILFLHIKYQESPVFLSFPYFLDKEKKLSIDSFLENVEI